MRTIAEMRAMVEASRPCDGDSVAATMRRIAETHIVLMSELVDTIEMLRGIEPPVDREDTSS